MSEAVLARGPARAAPRLDALRASAVLWFAVATIGQWLFATYVVAYYGPRLAANGLAGFSGASLMGGYVAGDTLGNVTVASHILLAVLIHGGGPLQFIPQVRRRAPTFHRWTGRAFLAAVAVSAVSGLYLAFVRGSNLGLLDVGGNTATSILLAVFGVMALRCAMARNLDAHRRWALRLFLVAGAVWFKRLGIYGSQLASRLAGVDFKHISGPVFDVMNVAKLLVPPGVLETYFWAQRRAGVNGRTAVTGLLLAATAATGVGIYAVTTLTWLPRILG